MSETVGRINLEKARKAVDLVRGNYEKKPGSSRVTQRVVANLEKDMLLKGRAGKFHFECDEPPERGGEDAAPSPLQFFMIGAAF